jgi:hypothetical protein
MSAEDILAYLRLSHYDAHQFGRYLPRLIELAPGLERDERRAVIEAVDRVWALYFPLGEALDLAHAIARLLCEMDEHRRALEYFERSAQRYGAGNGTSANREELMKHTASGSKANLQPRRAPQADLSRGDGAAALAPPRYGIDFVDRGLSAPEAGPAAAPVQRQPKPEEDEKLLQGKFDAAAGPVQRNSEAAPNQTGMPDGLKANMESLSGMDLSSVRVNFNSDKPARLDAAAYTQGSDIHLAPGQEKHLAHEAWHVVQQRQGRVQPTMELNGARINDDAGLEKEADVMGGRAARGS